MDNRTLVGIVIVVVLVLAGLPVVSKIVKESRGPDPALDAGHIERIQQAVDAYGQDMGAYPPYLAALTPDYLDSVPTAHDGKSFFYDARTGLVAPPQVPVKKAKEGTGLTPMGDAMTGLSVQEELNF
jgi:hypothetical protein